MYSTSNQSATFRDMGRGGLPIRSRHVRIRVVVARRVHQAVTCSRTPSAPSIVDVAIHVGVGRNDRSRGSVDVHLLVSCECYVAITHVRINQ